MPTVLMIAGHGKKKNGAFDPGAANLISEGEHRYVRDTLFPAMKRHLPEGANVVFFSEYNVFSHGNIATLAKRYGNDTIVCEWHFDANSTSGGHVIVWSAFKPDAIDLALRDAIKKNIGTVLHRHQGEPGISGRQLGNAGRCASAGINYRLIELGGSRNAGDVAVMKNGVDAYARDLVAAIFGAVGTKAPASKPADKPVPAPSPAAPQKKSVSQMADEVLTGRHGNGHDARRASLGISAAEYEKVRAEVNARLGGKKPASSKPASKTVDQMAHEVIIGKHGNGHDARRKSLGVSAAVYAKVRTRVNQLMR